MAGLLPTDYAVIRQLIAAQAQEFRKPQNGLLRPGMCTGYNVISRVAQIRMDGAVDALPIENITTAILAEGMRVMVLYQPPSGAYVIGCISTAGAVGVAIAGNVTVPDGGGGPTVPISGMSAVVIDKYAFWNATAGTFTVPTGLAGLYLLTAEANIGGVSPTRLFAQWETGGVVWRDSAGSIGDVTGPPVLVDSVVSSAVVTYLDAGSVLTPSLYQISGADRVVSVNLQFWLSQQTPEI